MGKDTGFKEFIREVPQRRPVAERINDWFEVYQPFPEEKVQVQASRCMDCGVPFCHTGSAGIGCPVNNLIPDWNDLVYRGRWKEAIRLLHSTNNFPEFTGRICPAPCESSCVLGIIEPPVAIKQVEKTIIEHAFEKGWIQPEPPVRRTGKRVAVIGSGPSGLAAAQQLNRAGHSVTVFEKADKVGGLLRYGIPEFKLEKHVIDRRVDLMEQEGIKFKTNSHVGVNVEVEKLRREFDVILLTGGAESPRDLNVPGRHLNGVHFAMEFLPQANRRAVGEAVTGEQILATGKKVLVIGGGDTGADCLGTSIRQGCSDIKMWELLPQPTNERPANQPWPLYPRILRVESAHEEWSPDCRDYSIMTTRLIGDDQGNVKQLEAVRVGPAPRFEPIPGSEFTIDVDLVLLALGFLGPVKGGMMEQLGVELDQRGNVATNNYATSVPGVFAAGDMRRGQSLVVWAIREGRESAEAIDQYLSAQVENAA